MIFIKKKSSKTGYQIYCKSCSRNCVKRHYKSNSSEVLDKKKKYRSTDEYKLKSKIYEKKYSSRRKELKRNNINLKISASMRDILRRCLKYIGKSKSSNTFNLLGYDNLKLKQRLECQFKDGMSWDNYGEWHIDHKKPVSKFDKGSSIKTINSLCNLQPLWARENLSKGNKF